MIERGAVIEGRRRRRQYLVEIVLQRQIVIVFAFQQRLSIDDVLLQLQLVVVAIAGASLHLVTTFEQRPAVVGPVVIGR